MKQDRNSLYDEFISVAETGRKDWEGLEKGRDDGSQQRVIEKGTLMQEQFTEKDEEYQEISNLIDLAYSYKFCQEKL